MLTLKVLKCTSLRNVARVIKQDPFVQIRLDGYPEAGEDRTGVCLAGGKNPKWLSGNMVHLKVPRPEMTCIVEVWDKEFTQANRLIATGAIALNDYDEDGAEEEPLDLELFFEGKSAGTMSCLFTYDPPAPIPESPVRRPKLVEKMKEGKVYQLGVQVAEPLWHFWQPLAIAQKAKIIGSVVAILFVPILWYFFTFLLSIGFSLTWYTTTWVLIPLAVITAMPRFLGWTLTFILDIVLQGYPLTFGTIAILPYMTDLKRLRIRLTVHDFFMGNPPNQGFTPKFLSLDRVDVTFGVDVKDLLNVFKGMRTEPCPLKKVPDFQRLLTVHVDRMEFDGFTMDFQVSNRNRLNINELTREFALGEVKTALQSKGIQPDKFRFPNCLEVQVVRARNLLAMDPNGLSDPFYVVKLRKEKRKSDPVMMCLNPLFPSKVEQFPLHDPSAVIQVQIWDADFGKRSDFIGQWIMTSKWLLMDPKHCDYVEWEDNLSEKEKMDGWVGFWAPLVDSHFRQRGQRGDVHIRLRWVYNPAFPPRQNPPPPTTLKATEQITENRQETRMRLGDLSALVHKLNHVPVLFNFQGPVLIRDAKVSVNDLLFGYSSTSSSIFKKIRASSSSTTTTSPPPTAQRRLQKTTSASSTDSAAHEDKIGINTTSMPQQQTNSMLTCVSPREETSQREPSTNSGSTPKTEPSAGGLLRRFLRKKDDPQQDDAKEDNDAFLRENSQGEVTFESTKKLLPMAGPVANAVAAKLEQHLRPKQGDDTIDELDGNDDLEYEENGRHFVKINVIEWHTQFKARHGDPGLPVFKLLDRFFRGLAPKLAANQKLQMRLLGTTFKGFVIDEFLLNPELVTKGALNAAAKVVSTAREVAKVAKEQTKFVEKKYFSSSAHRSTTILKQRATSGRKRSGTDDGKHELTDHDDHDAEETQEEEDDTTWSSRKRSSSSSTTGAMPTRKAEATDHDFIAGELLVRGKLETQWEGRKASLFASLRGKDTWRMWHFEAKGSTLFFRKEPQTIWYVLDLSDVTGLFIDQVELVLRFGGGPLALRLRLPVQAILTSSSPTTISKEQVTDQMTLEDWIAIFTKLKQVQQASKYDFAQGLEQVLNVMTPMPSRNTPTKSPTMAAVPEGNEQQTMEAEEQDDLEGAEMRRSGSFAGRILRKITGAGRSRSAPSAMESKELGSPIEPSSPVLSPLEEEEVAGLGTGVSSLQGMVRSDSDGEDKVIA